MGWKEELEKVPCGFGAVIYDTIKSTTGALNFDKAKIRLSQHDVCRLQKIFPNLNLRKVRYVNNSRRPTNAYFFSGGKSMTLGYTIYFEKKKGQHTWNHIIHELSHVEQYRKLGNSDYKFGCEYGKEYVRANFSYSNNEMEKDADEFANNNPLPSACYFNGEIYRVDPDARRFLRLIFGGEGFNKKWDHILTGNFDGNIYIPDIAFYTKSSGTFSIYRFLRDGKYPFFRIYRNSSFRKSWDIIVAGHFWGSFSYTDLLFYDRNAGHGEILRIDFSKRLPVKKVFGGDGWRKNWHSIISGEFWGRSGHDDLMFYDKQKGEMEFYRINPDSSIPMKKKKTIQTRKSWDIIVAGEFVGRSGHTDLLCYDRAAGEGIFYRINPRARTFMKQHTKFSNWRKTWSIITKGQFGGTGNRHDLLFYDKKNGVGEIYRIDPKARYFMKRKYRGNWRKTWSIITTGEFGGTGGKEDIFFYEGN